MAHGSSKGIGQSNKPGLEVPLGEVRRNSDGGAVMNTTRKTFETPKSGPKSSLSFDETNNPKEKVVSLKVHIMKIEK